MNNFDIELINSKEREIYETLNNAITAAIGLFGIVANVMNIMIFYKQGFANTMNISYCGLAVSDLCALISVIGHGVCMNPLLVNSGIPVVFQDIGYLAGGGTHTCFTRITGWITAFITAERCLCITMPLKIKQLITPARTKYIIFVIYLVVVVSFLPEYTTCYYGWKFFPDRNRSLIALVFTSNKKHVEGLLYIFVSLLGLLNFIAVILFTAVLVVQLNRKSKWRRTTNVDTARSDAISIRDKKTMKMVAMIATVLIVCYTPGVAVSAVSFTVSGVTLVGKNVNAFFTFWSFAFIFQSFNSSVNIFLYYRMSTKYKETFHQIFGFRNTTLIKTEST